MLSSGVAAFVNRLLDADPAARDSLAPFAGRAVRFVLAPLPDLRLAVRADGSLTAADAPEFHLVVTLTPGTLAALARRDEAAARTVTFMGDAEFAAVLQRVAGQLEWDVEEDLSKVVGDVAAHRLAQTARSFAAWQREAALRLGENLAEYVTEEAALLAARAEVDAFAREVAELRDAVERLEKRVELAVRSAGD
jgi:ubiquinone biosynthesis protein UbiJ